MGDTCKLCLKFIQGDSMAALDKNLLAKLVFIQLDLNRCAEENNSICSECKETIQNAFDFKFCLVQTESSDTGPSGSNNSGKYSTEKTICRFCKNSVAIISVISLKELLKDDNIMKVFKGHIPEVELKELNSMVCEPCQKSLASFSMLVSSWSIANDWNEGDDNMKNDIDNFVVCEVKKEDGDEFLDSNTNFSCAVDASDCGKILKKSKGNGGQITKVKTEGDEVSDSSESVSMNNKNVKMKENEEDDLDANLQLKDEEVDIKDEDGHSKRTRVKAVSNSIGNKDVQGLQEDQINPFANGLIQNTMPSILTDAENRNESLLNSEDQLLKPVGHQYISYSTTRNTEKPSSNYSSTKFRTEIEELRSLLTSWNQVEVLEQLTREKIFVNILKIIKRHHIEKVLKTFDMATQITFENNLEIWRHSIGLPLNDYHSNYACYAINPPSPTLSSVPSTSACSSSVIPYSRLATPDEGNGITLANILNETAKGGMLVEYYKKFQKFRNEQRTMLIQTVAQYFEEKGVQMSLSTSYRLEREILERFPAEKLEYYRTSKRGKLYNKFSNLKSTFKTAVSQHVIKKAEKVPPTRTNRSEKKLDPEPNAEDCMKVLKYNNLTAEEFDMYWKSCSQYRLQQIHGTKEADVFKNWPQYKRPSGYRLIDMDFNVLHDNPNGLLDNWEPCKEKLIFFLKQSVRDKGVKSLLESLSKPDLSENSRDALILWGLHGYLVPTNRITKKDDMSGKFNITKFTIKDSQESFLFIGKNTEEIEDHLIFLQNQKKTKQPLIFCIGDDITTIREIFIYFEGIKFSFCNFLRTVDICFKIFFVFNLDFPKESLMFWTFIETFFFKLKSSCSFSKVHELSEYLSQND